MHRRTLHTLMSIGVTAALAATVATTPAQAGPAQRPTDTAATPVTVHSLTDHLAHRLSLADSATIDRLGAAAAAGPVDLATAGLDARLAATVRATNSRVLTAKGLPANSGSLLQLRLAHPDMRDDLAAGETPLLAAPATDDTVEQVTAYDRGGATVLLDPVRLPDRPVLLVEVDTSKALTLGLTVMRQILDERGVRSARTAAAAAGSEVSAAGGYWATKVNAIRLADDHEPWAKGDAEIFNIVGGFGFDGKATIDTVQMPYLDTDGTTYYPNQILVHYNRYKYNLADVVMMEDDGDTNYQSLAQAIATALLTIVDGGTYIPLVNAILQAIPTSWWTDDPDYVDSWYTLATTSSGRLNGAAGNGWMDVAPYWVQEL